MSLLEQIETDRSRQLQTNYMGFVSFSILLYDHIDTFGDEVEYIWGGSKGPLVYLFFLNRYLTPLGFIVNLYAYLSNVWTPESCQRFIRYEGSMTMIGIEVVGLMMLLRVYAMYYNRLWVVSITAFILFGQTCVNAWLLTKGVAVTHIRESGVHSCTMIFQTSWSVAASSSAWIPLLYDTVVLGLTIKRTYPSIKDNNGTKSTGDLLRVLLRDGILYYSVIFCVTLVLALMINTAPEGLKNISAQLELLITVTMMSRITLNLKKKGARKSAAANVDTTFRVRHPQIAALLPTISLGPNFPGTATFGRIFDAHPRHQSRGGHTGMGASNNAADPDEYSGSDVGISEIDRDSHEFRRQSRGKDVEWNGTETLEG